MVSGYIGTMGISFSARWQFHGRVNICRPSNIVQALGMWTCTRALAVVHFSTREARDFAFSFFVFVLFFKEKWWKVSPVIFFLVVGWWGVKRVHSSSGVSFSVRAMFASFLSPPLVLCGERYQFPTTELEGFVGYGYRTGASMVSDTCVCVSCVGALSSRLHSVHFSGHTLSDFMGNWTLYELQVLALPLWLKELGSTSWMSYVVLIFTH